jgi:hypothetical protein
MIIPLEAIRFTRQLVERHATLARFEYKMTELCHHTYQVLDLSLGSGGCNYSMASTFFGFLSIPQADTI